MLSDQLIRIIESHAEELTEDALATLRGSPHTPAYHALALEELHHRIFEVYHDLSCWLLGKPDHHVQDRYEDLGRQRFKQGVPLAQVLWALVLIKENLREAIGLYISADSALELHQEREIYRLVERFFDRASCYTAEAYEREASKQAAAMKPASGKMSATASLYKRLHIH